MESENSDSTMPKKSTVFPTLYEINSNRTKIKVWQIRVVPVEGTDFADIITEYGQQGGKQSKSTKRISKGKNIGKANETTPYKQALNEATSKFTKKQESGYSTEVPTIGGNSSLVPTGKTEKTASNSGGNFTVLPMLAHDYNKRGHDIKFPCMIQPKLDGVRCMIYRDTDGTLKVVSRTGKPYNNAQHIVDELLEHKIPLGDYVLDGELYSTTLSFEDLTGLCRRNTLKKGDKEKLTQIHFWCFDLFDRANEDSPFNQRYKTLSRLLTAQELVYTKLVDTAIIQAKEHLPDHHHQHTIAGYEGSILRNDLGPYTLKNRSKHLQKYKVFQDSEFTITGFSEATGNDTGTIIFECEYTTTSKSKATFSCRPRGTREQRTEWFDNGDKLIGKQLTVRYQELTAEGCPRFPVGITIRDYE